jgi:hypothetical protein
MISDALSECVSEIDRYLSNPMYAALYRFIERRLRRVRDEMDEVRAILDTPPNDAPPEDARPSIIQWIEKNGLGSAERSGSSWIVRSDDRAD